jgi:hypothetical protein
MSTGPMVMGENLVLVDKMGNPMSAVMQICLDENKPASMVKTFALIPQELGSPHETFEDMGKIFSTIPMHSSFMTVHG